MIEVQFPPSHSRGGVFEVVHDTEISRTTRGREQRNKASTKPRRRLEIDYSNRVQADLDELMAFALMAGGAHEAFRVKCWPDYTHGSAPQPLGTGTGALTTFQLKKTYSVPSPGVAHVRTIDKPVQGTVVVYKAGVAQTETTHYTVDYTTGVITFLAAPALGQAITAEFEFDTRMRFEDDVFSVTLDAHEVYSVGVVSLIEVFED